MTIQVGNANWNAFKNIVNNIHDSFNQETIIWKRFTSGLGRWGEGKESEITYDTINLKCLIEFDIFRKWPTVMPTSAGELDRGNMAVLLNIKYLNDLGYINSDGNFDYQSGKDYFIYKGQRYKAAGDTFAAQAKDTPLLIQIIMKREEIETGEKRY